MRSRSYRDLSRIDWVTDAKSHEQIQLGAILRIADAVEKMAQSYSQLIHEREYYERRFRQSQESVQRLSRSNAALRGHIKRMHNQETK